MSELQRTDLLPRASNVEGEGPPLKQVRLGGRRANGAQRRGMGGSSQGQGEEESERERPRKRLRRHKEKENHRHRHHSPHPSHHHNSLPSPHHMSDHTYSRPFTPPIPTSHYPALPPPLSHTPGTSNNSRVIIDLCTPSPAGKTSSSSQTTQLTLPPTTSSLQGAHPNSSEDLTSGEGAPSHGPSPSNLPAGVGGASSTTGESVAHSSTQSVQFPPLRNNSQRTWNEAVVGGETTSQPLHSTRQPETGNSSGRGATSESEQSLPQPHSNSYYLSVQAVPSMDINSAAFSHGYNLRQRHPRDVPSPLTLTPSAPLAPSNDSESYLPTLPIPLASVRLRHFHPPEEIHVPASSDRRFMPLAVPVSSSSQTGLLGLEWGEQEGHWRNVAAQLDRNAAFITAHSGQSSRRQHRFPDQAIPQASGSLMPHDVFQRVPPPPPGHIPYYPTPRLASGISRTSDLNHDHSVETNPIISALHSHPSSLPTSSETEPSRIGTRSSATILPTVSSARAPRQDTRGYATFSLPAHSSRRGGEGGAEQGSSGVSHIHIGRGVWQRAGGSSHGSSEVEVIVVDDSEDEDENDDDVIIVMGDGQRRRQIANDESYARELQAQFDREASALEHHFPPSPHLWSSRGPSGVVPAGPSVPSQQSTASGDSSEGEEGPSLLRDNSDALLLMPSRVRAWTAADARRFLHVAATHRGRHRPRSRRELVNAVFDLSLSPAIFYQAIMGSTFRGNSYEDLLELAERLGPARPQGLSKEAINSLPVREFSRSDSEEENSCSCVVCMCEFAVREKVRTLPCTHDFHQKCIDQWLKDRKTCPICRVEIQTQ